MSLTFTKPAGRISAVALSAALGGALLLSGAGVANAAAAPSGVYDVFEIGLNGAGDQLVVDTEVHDVGAWNPGDHFAIPNVDGVGYIPGTSDIDWHLVSELDPNDYDDSDEVTFKVVSVAKNGGGASFELDIDGLGVLDANGEQLVADAYTTHADIDAEFRSGSGTYVVTVQAISHDPDIADSAPYAVTVVVS